MAPLQAIPVFGQMEDTSVQANCGRILGLWRLFESDSNNAPPHAIPVLGPMENTPDLLSVE